MLQRESGTSLGLPCEPAGGECPSSLLLAGSAVVLCDWKVLGLCFFLLVLQRKVPQGAGWIVGAQLPRFMCHLPCFGGTRAESSFCGPCGCSWLMQDTGLREGCR